MDDCIFCQIVEGSAPSSKLYEDDAVIAIMDIFPWTSGHSLIVTKEHAPTIFELSEPSAAAVMTAARKLAPALRDELSMEGLNLFQANGSAAWQTVDHFHLHLIPRYPNDGLKPPGAPYKGDPSVLAEIAERVRARLEG